MSQKWACLRSSGNMPEHSDAFIIFVIGLISLSRHAFSSVVGNGSRSRLVWRGHDYFPHFINSSRCESSWWRIHLRQIHVYMI